MTMTISELLQLVGNGGGLAMAAALVIYVMRQNERRESEMRTDNRNCNERYAKVAEALDGLSDEIRDLREAVKK